MERDAQPRIREDREGSEGRVYLPNTCYICIGRSLEEHHAPH